MGSPFTVPLMIVPLLTVPLVRDGRVIGFTWSKGFERQSWFVQLFTAADFTAGLAGKA